MFFFFLFFFPIPSCHRNALTSGKCASRSMRNLPFKYEPFSKRQPSSSSHTVSGIRLNELSDLSARAFSLPFTRMKRARRLPPQPEVYAFCSIIFSMISAIWPPWKSRGASLAKLHLRLILRIHLSGSIPSFSPQRRCCNWKKKKSPRYMY